MAARERHGLHRRTPQRRQSTLFNRLVGRRQAIVHDQPGVTRDRIVGRRRGGAGAPRRPGGHRRPGPRPADALGLSTQVYLAVEESDLLLLVVDGKEGLTAADPRRLGRACGPTQAHPAGGEQGRHAGGARGASRSSTGSASRTSCWSRPSTAPERRTSAKRSPPALPPSRRRTSAWSAEAPPIAIVGRPNVGKSSCSTGSWGGCACSSRPWRAPPATRSTR